MEEDRLKGVYYFVDERGGKPIKEFIRALPKNERAKILAYVIELKRQGNNLRRPMADYLGNGIYELRPKDNRIFYFFYLRDNAILVHAIKKYTKRIASRDLQLCIKRKRLVEESYGHIEKLEL
jgi:phage-related protein